MKSLINIFQISIARLQMNKRAGMFLGRFRAQQLTNTLWYDTELLPVVSPPINRLHLHFFFTQKIKSYKTQIKVL